VISQLQAPATISKRKEPRVLIGYEVGCRLVAMTSIGFFKSITQNIYFIPGLFNNAFDNSDYSVSNNRMIVINNWKGYGRKR
jgi:hypothetical protein